MHWFVHTLQSYPEIAIFLTLAVGFLIGGIKIGGFSLGNVTGVLLAGVLIGQLHIEVSPSVKAVFFLMFLFSVGYGVGPQFFSGLKGDGLPQVLFSIVVCVACLLSAYVAAKIAGYNIGQAAGLLAGASTISAVLGVATDSVGALDIPAADKKAMIDFMPVAYAVTYLFGTAGSAWFLATLGPKLLRVDLVKECKEYEAKLGKGEGAIETGYRKYTGRSYKVAAGSAWINKTIEQIEHDEVTKSLFVERLRQDGKIKEPTPSLVIREGDDIVIAGPTEHIVTMETVVGPETDDRELLQIVTEILDVVITNKAVAGRTLSTTRTGEFSEKARGVFLRKLIRGGHEIPFAPGTVIHRGDTVQIVGTRRDVERLAAFLGYADRETEKTDVIFMGFGVVLGALIGALSIKVGSVPISLSTSGGALIAGLVCGWLRSVHRTFGRIPAPALWAFNNMGLTIFIAVVGLTTGPSFITGLKQAGISLFLWGVFVTTMPLLIGLLAGKYIFKMHPGILLGACAGARTTTAALGAIQEAAKSNVPALGYTITYAVGNTLLIIWGVVIVFMMK